MATTLRLILGDQLNIHHSWFKKVDENIVYVMMEMRQETDYVTHHIQKVAAFFASMRNFANELSSSGHNVKYLKINDIDNHQNIEENLTTLIKKYEATKFEYILPDEYRLDKQLSEFCHNCGISFSSADSEHFLAERNELSDFFKEKKQFVMEFFYRYMRKKYKLLLDENGEPEGGKWNFDQNNRKKWDEKTTIPKTYPVKNDVSGIVKEIAQAGIKTIGNIDAQNFSWPVNRNQSLEILDYFCKHHLKYFGTFQDAMHSREKFLFHSRLSFAMNAKLISPLEVVEKAIETYRNKHEIELSQIEGFARQIIGWREYMRGIYWKFMPQYAYENYFEHKRKLPGFYWTGNTKMNCLQKAIGQSLDESYAHHIQRLMITGNFALLAGVHPDEVDNWYLGIYIDAIEWVEITNTRGMSQFADGGIVATKPYISSANYIQKMSNYCSNCHYDYKSKTNINSCPFNSLYWNFLDENKKLLANNNRMAMMYNLLEKIPQNELNEIKKRAHFILNNLDNA